MRAAADLITGDRCGPSLDGGAVISGGKLWQPLGRTPNRMVRQGMQWMSQGLARKGFSRNSLGNAKMTHLRNVPLHACTFLSVSTGHKHLLVARRGSLIVLPVLLFPQSQTVTQEKGIDGDGDCSSALLCDCF